MPSNLTLSADERTLWMMAYAAASGAEFSIPTRRDTHEAISAVAGWASVCADAAIRALRERVAVEAVRPELGPGNALMRELATRDARKVAAEVALTDVELQAALPDCIPLSELPVEPPLTPERAREVMREYDTWFEVSLGTWRLHAENDNKFIFIGDATVNATVTDWATSFTITTESALRAICEGRKA